ncbi:MAG: hypothetical protein JSR99_08195 [Proteobacteria bacterium]|nr:hypothetical protein [Pseudomonadota bacterium]
MRVDWKERIRGVPILSVRNLLRRLGDSFRVEDIIRELRITAAKAKSVIRDLKRRGWLELVPKAKLSDRRRKERVQFFQLTIAGNAFAMARAAKRISRNEAGKRLNRFIQRIKAINANDDFGWYVDEARVFGSYLDKTVADLGDIDIALSLKWRLIIGRGKVEYSETRARASGKVINSFLRKITYAEYEVRLFLKNRDPYISIHDLSELVDIKAKSQLLYRAPKKDAKPRSARSPS